MKKDCFSNRPLRDLNSQPEISIEPKIQLILSHLTLLNRVSNKAWSWINKILISPWFSLFFIAVGVILRVRIYLANRNLWIDEGALSLNVLNRDLIGLFKPLDYAQAAPPGFLILEKVCVSLFGNNEYALRLIPLVSSLTAFVFFYFVAKSYLKPNVVPLALLLFAITNQLIFYSSDSKQYSTDVMIALILVWIALKIRADNYSVWQMVIIGFIGGLAIWLSHPAIFILAGIGSVLFVEKLIRQDRRKIIGLIITGFIWIVCFLIMYFVILKATSQNLSLQSYWISYFLVFPPKDFADLKLDLHFILSIFNDPAGYTIAFLAPLIFISGVIGMLWRKFINLMIIFSPIPFLLVASIFHYYPINGRLMLFILPGLIILISEGVSQIHIRSGNGSYIVTLILIVLLIYDPLKLAVSDFVNPPGLEEIKPVMTYIRDNWQTGDTLYLYYSSQIAFLYYAPIVGLSSKDAILGIASVNDPSQYQDDLLKLKGKKRVWILFSHVYDNGNGMNEKNYFLRILNQLGVKMASYSATGASAYLFDLAPN